MLCAFNVAGSRRSTHRQFDFSIINLFGEYQQPSIPYLSKSVDYQKMRDMVSELDKNVDQVTTDDLRLFGRLIWNHVIPGEVGDYLHAIEKEYSLQILLVTNDLYIPWEIIHDDRGFWALKYSLGRIYGTRIGLGLRSQVKGRHRKASKPPLLLICDPEDNLSHAKREGQVLCRRLQDTFEIHQLKHKVRALDMALAIGSDDYDIIHFAGHAVMGQHSFLKGYRSSLDSEAIADYSLPRNPVVFANACMTSAKDYYGANSKNIAEAFIEAGASAFVGTLWKTSDKWSADFAAMFYEYLRTGKTIGDSLRLAKCALAEKARDTNIDWASFTLFGDPDNRLFTVATKRGISLRRIQITMSNKPGTLGKILVEMSKLGVNIVRGRSITFDRELTAGYVAEVELLENLEEEVLKDRLLINLPKGLLHEMRFS
jgi:CHAT domain-containing protein